MLKFPVPPEYCLILNAFNQTESLRSAAALLGIDPPSLVRKVRRISAEFGYLQKVGNRWVVTESGRRVAQWTDEILLSQAELAHERPVLRISSFSWLAEEMLIPEYAHLKKMLDSNLICAFRMTAANQEQELIHSRSDLVIHGHAPTDPSIAYKRIRSLDWVVVAPTHWKKRMSGMSDSEIQKFLQKKNFIRHAQLNPEIALGFQPGRMGNLTIDGVIGLRSAVIHGEGWSVLPAMSVHRHFREKKLVRLSLKTYISDEVSVWWLRARKDLSETAKWAAQWISEFDVS